MKRWEYMYAGCSKLPNPYNSSNVVLFSSFLKKEMTVNEFGDKGWELCSIQAENNNSEWLFFFKRELVKTDKKNVKFKKGKPGKSTYNENMGRDPLF